MTTVRPMAPADIDDALMVVKEASDAGERAAGRDPVEPDEEVVSRMRTATRRFIDEDQGGAWVATDGDHVVGMAEAIRRGGFWGLAMLFVHPDHQGKGVGRSLMDAALTYADGSDVRMIMASSDPRALRRYSSAGLAIHPAVEAAGEVDRAALPAGLPGRSGEASDLDLVAEVDAGLGRSRAEDAGFLLRIGARLEIVDGPAGRGFAVSHGPRLRMLGATDEAAAAQVLWRFLAEAEGKAEVWGLTAQQDWAVRVALAARLNVVASGPLFVDGLDRLPGPWIPSGWFF